MNKYFIIDDWNKGVLASYNTPSETVEAYKRAIDDGYTEDDLIIIYGVKVKVVPPVGDWTVQEVRDEEG